MNSTNFSYSPFAVFYSRNPHEKQIDEMLKMGVKNVFLDFCNYPFERFFEQFDPVIYFNLGTLESFRKYAVSPYPKSVIGKSVEGWPNERWLDLTNYRTMECLKENIKITISFLRKKYPRWFPKIDLDNLDGWDYDTGFELDKKDVVEYVNEIISWFHREFEGEVCYRNGWELVDMLKGDAILCEEGLEQNFLKFYDRVQKPVYDIEYYKNTLSAFWNKKHCKKYQESYSNIRFIGANRNSNITYFYL